ncbi:ankyrin repeat-containing domain protein [Leptodontidium sp. MPI-SDFR-AT-0119]|nr:ankyrin repeat-containing domain protein [Leptodontidium sp. MPI-SDFR-AT-0119]
MEFVGQGNKEEVERLLSEDSSTRVAARDRMGSTPLEISIQKGHDDIFKLLLRYGADVSGESLYKFAREGQFECVETLLRHGVDINASNDFGKTALHGAASNGHESLLRFLIEKGADCQAGDSFNLTPLHCAALKGHVGVAIHLLASGAYVDSSARYYGTALHISAKGGHVTVASLLLEGGADANSMDGSMTPLHYASQRRCPEMIRMLLKANAHVNAKASGGYSPLFFALGNRYKRRHTHVESAKLLLAAGAEFSLMDWEHLSHEYKEIFANYRPAGAKWTQDADSTTVPWSAESDEKYADVLRASNRDNGQ